MFCKIMVSNIFVILAPNLRLCTNLYAIEVIIWVCAMRLWLVQIHMRVI